MTTKLPSVSVFERGADGFDDAVPLVPMTRPVSLSAGPDDLDRASPPFTEANFLGDQMV